MFSLEVPHWGTSNENPQHIFSWKEILDSLLGALVMSTHSICFPEEIRKIFIWLLLLSRGMCSLPFKTSWSSYWHSVWQDSALWHFFLSKKYMYLYFSPGKQMLWVLIKSDLQLFHLIRILAGYHIHAYIYTQCSYIQSTLFIPKLDTMTKFVIMTIWMSQNIRSRGDC